MSLCVHTTSGQVRRSLPRRVAGRLPSEPTRTNLAWLNIGCSIFSKMNTTSEPICRRSVSRCSGLSLVVGCPRVDGVRRVARSDRTRFGRGSVDSHPLSDDRVAFKGLMLGSAGRWEFRPDNRRARTELTSLSAALLPRV